MVLGNDHLSILGSVGAFDLSVSEKAIFIALPAYKGQMSSATGVSAAYAAAMITSMGYDPIISTLSMPDLPLLRNLFLSVWFEKTPAKYFLTIDDDMEFSPDLIRSMIELDEPVVGTIYPHKSYPVRFVVKGDMMPDKRIEHPTDERFCQVDGIGMGCTLIRRDAIDQLLAAGLPFQTEGIEKLGIAQSIKSIGGLPRLLRAFDLLKADDGVQLSEDLSFCHRWRSIGGKVWAAQGWEIGHFGPHVWRGQFDQFGVEDGKVVLK